MSIDDDYTTDYSEECDYNYLRKKIVEVLRKHFETNDNGDPNPEFNDSFTSQDALDEIHDIVGEI